MNALASSLFCCSPKFAFYYNTGAEEEGRVQASPWGADSEWEACTGAYLRCVRTGDFPMRLQHRHREAEPGPHFVRIPYCPPETC